MSVGGTPGPGSAGRSPFEIRGDAPNPRMAVLFGQLGACRHFTHSIVRDLGPDALAARTPAGPNTIADILVHLAATERMMRNLTTLGRRFGDDEAEHAAAFRFERDPLAGAALGAYLERLEGERRASLGALAEREDAWLDEPRTFAGRAATNGYFWFHLMLDEARHLGQVAIMRKYLLPGASAEFDPYGGL